MQNFGYLNTVTERRASVSSIRVSKAAHNLIVKQVLNQFIELLHSSALNTNLYLILAEFMNVSAFKLYITHGRVQVLENKHKMQFKDSFLSVLIKLPYILPSTLPAKYFHFSLDQFLLATRRKGINDLAYMKENEDRCYSGLHFNFVRNILKLSAFYVNHFA